MTRRNYSAVIGFGLSLLLAFCHPRPAAAVAPANAECAGAISIAAPSTTTGSSLGASPQADPACGTQNLFQAPSVWYSVVGTGERFVASTCGTSWDTQLNVYSGSCATLTCEAGNDDSCGFQSETCWATNPGEVYFVQVSGFGTSDAGEFDLTLATLPAAPHDFVCSAAPLTLGTPQPFDLICGSTEASEVAAPQGSGLGDGWFFAGVNSSHWYTFVAPQEGCVTVESDVEAQLALYAVADCGDFSSFAFLGGADLVNPATGTVLLESISGLTPGATYYLQVDAQFGLSYPAGNLLVTACPPERTTDCLVALYNFREGSGTTVSDLSGQTPALDLTISDLSAVTWIPDGGLRVDSPVFITSDPATRVVDDCVASNAVTVEAWAKMANSWQGGPARIVTCSENGQAAGGNFVLGQQGSQFYQRCRTTATNQYGTPNFASGSQVDTSAVQHIVYTRAANGDERFYVDGVLQSTGQRFGSFTGSWSNYVISLANEPNFDVNGNDRPWLGELHLVALYKKALDASEVTQNYMAGSNPLIIAPPAPSYVLDVNQQQHALSPGEDWSFAVTLFNDGNVPLLPEVSSMDCQALEYLEGDNGNQVLDPGETFIYRCYRFNVQADFCGQVTASVTTVGSLVMAGGGDSTYYVMDADTGPGEYSGPASPDNPDPDQQADNVPADFTLAYFLPNQTVEACVTVTTSPPPPPADFEARINCGGPEVVLSGQTWLADAYANGGGTASTNALIGGTDIDEIYQTERYGNCTYSIPVPQGTYTVVLHFAEIYFGAPGRGPAGAGRRVFDVDIEGAPALTSYDLFADVGALEAVTYTYSSITVNDGSLTVALTTIVDNAKISGIEILSEAVVPPLPAPPFAVTRINCGGPEVVAGGATWSADAYYTGGGAYSRNTAIDNTALDVLYTTERAGNCTYEIPAPGNASVVTVVLHFAEIYWGAPGGGPGGSGLRVFDFDVEGNQVFNFDIFDDAGAAAATTWTFTSIPVTDGFVTIDFTTIVDNAKVSAIEVREVQ